MTADTIADEIRALRAALDETTTHFAKRFWRSARTIEDWEQGRRHPDALCRQILKKLRAGQAKKRRNTLKRKHLSHSDKITRSAAILLDTDTA
jgi:DNA-binding XRE family transcriptional regulator